MHTQSTFHQFLIIIYCPFLLLGESNGVLDFKFSIAEKRYINSFISTHKNWVFQALDRGAAKMKADKMATGHNADDIAETVLLNIIRGDIARYFW